MTAATVFADARENGGYEVRTVLPDSGRFVSVDVYPPYAGFGRINPACVNWAGIGSCTAADTERYSEVLAVASRLAAEINQNDERITT